ncbi:unnamed protein product [Peniophora sp. CBMAI 1063]|nr:unnamed protein product [Peniophora sp. CBMAI 1063]
MSGSKASQAFGGFSTLPVAYASSEHIIYLRAQAGAAKGKSAISWPEDRTMFMVNLPPDATERELVLLFKSCGTVERVVFDSDENRGLADEEGLSDEEEGMDEDEDSDEEQPRKRRKVAQGDDTPRPPKVVPLPALGTRRLRRTGHTAHVIFLDASSCERALALSPSTSSCKKATTQSRPWPTDDLAPSGIAHYTTLYDALRPPLDVVLAHANTSVELFDYQQAEKKRAFQRESKYRKGEAIVDEDGFTLVTRGGAYGKAVGGGVGVASKKFTLARGRKAAHGEGRKRKHKDEKEKDAFYAFQVHEKKRKALMDLKEKWEQDKAAVEKLRASRKFKPY